MLRQIPRQTTGRSSVDCSRPAQRPSPNSCRVGVCSNSLGTCSGFTRVAACVLAQPPFRGLLSRGFENHGRFGTVTSPDSYRGASTTPRAGLAPAGEVHLHGAQENQFRRNSGSPCPRVRKRCGACSGLRIMGIRGPRVLSGISRNLFQTPMRSKLWPAPRLLRGVYFIRQVRRCREPDENQCGVFGEEAKQSARNRLREEDAADNRVRIDDNTLTGLHRSCA